MEKNYEKLEKLGAGSYGVVYKGLHKATMKLFALKKIRFMDPDQGVPATAIREIASLKNLDHRNIIRIHDFALNRKRVYLVLEYMDQDLKRFMDSCSGFAANRSLIKSFLKQIPQGIHYCHTHRLLHRDLKPQNLLIDRQTQTLKIADFGLTREVRSFLRPLTHEVVALYYRAPEILLEARQYSTPVDIWSVGCIFAEMVNQKLLFPGESEIDQLFKIFRVLGTPNEQSWPGVSRLLNLNSAILPRFQAQDLATIVPNLEPAGLDLLSKMLRYDPSERITAREALEHEYFQGPRVSSSPATPASQDQADAVHPEEDAIVQAEHGPRRGARKRRRYLPFQGPECDCLQKRPRV